VQPEVRRHQAAGHAIKIREKIRKLFKDKKAGKSYGLGMNDPSKKECKGKKENTNECNHCGKIGHSRRSSKDCTFTTHKNKKKSGKYGLTDVVTPK
jgi:hypothetical protein